MNTELLVAIIGLPPGPQRDVFASLLTAEDCDLLSATYEAELALHQAAHAIGLRIHDLRPPDPEEHP